MAFDYDLKRAGWFPAARRFQDAIGHTSNFPLSYLYAIFLALSGHVLGRKASIRYASTLYPNSYVCLVGDSGIHHKSTAINLGMEALGEELAADFPPLSSVTTAQGLLIAMENAGGSGLVKLDELATLLTKKKQDFAADLLSRIVELYACPAQAGTYTRHDPIEVHNTFLTIISASTVEWLQASLTASDLMAGFGNRMTFVLGDPRKEKDWPQPPDFDEIDFTVLTDFNAKCTLDEFAHEMWRDFYTKFQGRQKKAAAFVRVLAERIPEKVLKNCVVQAGWNKNAIIGTPTLEGAIDWGWYLYDCVERLTPSFEQGESQVLAEIKAGVSMRQDLYKRLNHRLDGEKIKRALDALRWFGFIKEDKVTGKLTAVDNK